MAAKKWVQVILKIPKEEARELDTAASKLGFRTKSQYVRLLHRAVRKAAALGHLEKRVLKELADSGNLKGKATPTLEQLARAVQSPPDEVTKALEGLQLRGLLAAMTRPSRGMFANDVTAYGSRFRVTPLGVKFAGFPLP